MCRFEENVKNFLKYNGRHSTAAFSLFLYVKIKVCVSFFFFVRSYEVERRHTKAAIFKILLLIYSPLLMPSLG